jgi:hypothetical protein
MILKSKSLKKKYIEGDDIEDLTDGVNRYPKYTEKIVATKNYQQFKHMVKGKVHLPSIGWQTGLRNY